MRYAQMIALRDMCGTLAEAAAYLAATPGSPLRAELLPEGERMLELMETELVRHPEDLKSEGPLRRVQTLRRLWPEQGGGLETELRSLAQELPQVLRYQVRALVVADQSTTWDAKESICRFLRSDPRFDPVVVLIPVFRSREINGTVQRETIYSDYLTPRGVPFEAYDTYDPQEDRPDVVFTSQPYEQTLPDAYWPERLAAAGRLVFVPYFTPDQIRDNVTEYFTTLPAYNSSWKIICSNRRLYDFYCRVRPDLEGRLLVAGMPKLDGIVELSKTGIALPEGWERLRGKKVFLWNNWYVLDITFQFVHKTIYNWFRTHEDCALIWRPHPMMLPFNRLSRPELYPSLLEIIRRFCALPNVILDEAPSFYPAFWYSDAMISDLSSMLPQYLLMDKPALAFLSSYWEQLGDRFIDDDWITTADVEHNPQAAADFLDQVSAGGDPGRDLRRRIREKDMALEDGRSGERVCRMVWDALHREDGLDPEAWGN